MKKGRIILGAAAAIVSLGGTLAFNVAHKFTKHNVWVKTASGCKVCQTVFTGASVNASCHTINGGTQAGINNKTFFKTSACQNSKTNKTSLDN